MLPVFLNKLARSQDLLIRFRAAANADECDAMVQRPAGSRLVDHRASADRVDAACGISCQSRDLRAKGWGSHTNRIVAAQSTNLREN